MNKDILDWEEFLERVQDDQELALELFEIYTADYEEKIPRLETAVSGSDFDEVRSIAHSLKGSSGNVSAKELRETFRILEDKGQDRNLDGASDLLTRLAEEYKRFQEAVEERKESCA